MSQPEAQCQVCDQWSAAEWTKDRFGGGRWLWVGAKECPNCETDVLPNQLRNLVRVNIVLESQAPMPIRCPKCEQVSNVRIEEYQKLVEAERTFGHAAKEFALGMTCDCGFFGGTMEWTIVRP